MIHPSRKIIGERSEALKGKKVIVGVTASVALYKSLDLVRELMRRGADVTVVLTKKASQMISPMMFEWASGNKTFVEFKGELGHIALAEENDAMIIAPCTINTLTKIAYGIADNSVSLVALTMLGGKKGVAIVPAMHIQLYETEQYRVAVNKLESQGVQIMEPEIVKDKAHIPEVEDIASFFEAVTLRGKDLRGKKFLVTAGPTREYLDPVRFITNASSGEMGIQISREISFRGGEVTLIAGNITTNTKVVAKRVINVETTNQMKEKVIDEIKKGEYDSVILAGAPADYSFSINSNDKIKSEIGNLSVELRATPKIAKEVREHFMGNLVIFSAETVNGNIEELSKRAREKLYKYSADIVVANDVSRKDIGFRSKYNEVLIIDKDGKEVFVSFNLKSIIARYIVDKVKERILK